ncbi:MAG: signal recognition particle-docking protein FtsY [Victivallaceae bacterium]|nr:signal recognition particle-docking protein FtsY [Victivallaceae bacterium]
MSSIFSIFKRGLEKTATRVSRSVAGLFTGVTAWTDETFEDLESCLILADFGVNASTAIVKEVRDQYSRGKIATSADIFEVAGTLVKSMLEKNMRPINFQNPGPTVILFVGVNGSGKTTTIGKLAARFAGEKRKVMLAAGDTFRAAAVEQLELWGERTGAAVISAKHGADPAAVAFDAATAARSRGADVLMIDTAGRQQTKKSLMDELAKIHRAIDKACPGAPHEVWLTIDASCGGNALSQAREFSEVAAVTGIVLTKLDGSGKGGMAVALNNEYNLPVFFAGMGEQPDDLQEFNPALYADALFSTGEKN